MASGSPPDERTAPAGAVRLAEAVAGGSSDGQLHRNSRAETAMPATA